MLSVLLVSEHKFLLQTLRTLLESQPDIAVVGDAESGTEAVRLAKKTRPEVVLMDVTTPGLEAGQATRQVLRGQRATKVLALTGYGHLDKVQEMLEAGAAGYLSEAATAGELLGALRTLNKSRAASIPQPARPLREESWEAGAGRHFAAALSPGLRAPRRTHPVQCG